MHLSCCMQCRRFTTSLCTWYDMSVCHLSQAVLSIIDNWQIPDNRGVVREGVMICSGLATYAQQPINH